MLSVMITYASFKLLVDSQANELRYPAHIVILNTGDIGLVTAADQVVYTSQVIPGSDDETDLNTWASKCVDARP